MLFVHDAYEVVGEREFEFEDAVREGYSSAVADDDTRFLRYLRSVHGSSKGYFVVMLTALRDGAALDRLVHRLRYGDLGSYATHIASMCHHARSTLLVDADWAQTQLELAGIPVDGAEHPTAFFREDAFDGVGINAALAGASCTERSDDVLEFEAAFRPALDSDTAARVLYRITNTERFTNVWSRDALWGDWPGSLTPSVPDGVRGSSRYLRSAAWSPLS